MTEHDDRFRLATARRDETQSLEAELTIDAPADAVWKALTDAEELMRWFPFQAKVEPGAGGTIWMSWDGSFEDSQPIQAWEPERRLVTGWPLPTPPGEKPAPPTVVEYRLEARGSSTRLRLVHSGFPTGDDWDDIFESHRRGWSYELRSLRHYLEHHRGRSRRIAKVRRSVEPLDEAATWALLWSVRGLGPERPPERGPYVLDLPSGHRLEGRVMICQPPTDLGATVRAIDGVAGSESSLLRISIEAWCGPGGPTELSMWLATWGARADDVTAIQDRWETMVDRMLATASG